MNKSSVVIFILFILLTTSVHAKMYKCVDSSGKTSFQQKPCAKDSSQKVVNQPYVESKKKL